MDALYSREVAPSYVPAFAARLVLAMAKGVQRAGGELKRTFDEDLPDLWVLAMVVVQWYADQLPSAEAQAVTSTLKEFSLGALAANLNLFRERLLPFVKTAHEAQGEAQLAAAGAYFVAAVEQIGMRLLASAMNAAPLQALKGRLLLRVPPPAGLKEEYERALGFVQEPSADPPSPPRKTPASGVSRAERFDRADFVRSAARAPTSRRAEKPSRSTPSAATPPRPPDPDLDDATVTQAYLLTLGWKSEEVERLAAGPKGKPPRTVNGKRIA